MAINVGISQLAVSKDIEDVLVTYSLGSCIGISMYDPEAKVGGLIHCMLPLSKIDPEKAKSTPAMYTDSGFILLLTSVLKLGGTKDNLVIKVAGCGSPMDKNGRFKIGERNHAVFKKLLWKNNLLVAGEDIGGTKPRTLRLYMKTGDTTVSSGRSVDKI